MKAISLMFDFDGKQKKKKIQSPWYPNKQVAIFYR